MRSFVLLVVAMLALTEAGLPEKCKNPPKVPPNECCKGYIELFDMDMMANCGFEKIKDDEALICEPFTCMIKKYGFLGANNKMDKSKTKADLTKAFTGDWAPVVQNVADKCFELLENKKSDCEPRAFSLCFMQKTMEFCPKSLWKESKECNEVKTFVKECSKEIF